MNRVVNIAIFLGLLVSSSAAADAPLFDLVTEKPTAAPGDYVLCPSRQFYDAAVEKGVDKTTFIYYAAKMIEVGDQESTVQNLAGSKFSLPNPLIVSIPRDQRAKVGDVVVSWWQSGSGMQRCIVVGGTPTEPVVRYLDITYDNPSGAGQKEDTLKPGSFYVLNQPWMVGSTVAVQSGRQERYGLLLAKSEKKILVREFAGKLKVYDRDLATPLPQQPSLSAGDAAEAALFGSMKPVTVVKVDAKIGRVFCTYQLGRTEKEKAFAFGEIRPEK